MAFGSTTISPGYRGPTASLGIGGGPPRPRSSSRGVSRGLVDPGFGGGFGPSRSSLPSYKPPSTRAPTAPSAAGSTAQLSFPQHQPYKPQTYQDPNLGVMAGYGKGMMDPESDYYKRLSAGMQRQIGEQADVQGRGAALRAAWGGMGGGASPELMATQADISQSGLEAQGVAESGLRLQAPQIGAQMMQSTFGPQLGYNQLGEGSRQFGAGLGEQARQWGGQMGLQQQQMAQQQAWQQAQMQQQWASQQAQMQHEAAMQAQAAAYSGLG